MSRGRVRVYIACSLDGFVAGPDDDLSWLPGFDGSAPKIEPETDAVSYEAFMAEVGALLIGRRTYDVVTGFAGPWPYGDKPVLVATRRAMNPVSEHVRAICGEIGGLIDAAIEAAGGRDVYLDGGNLIRQALDAGRVDEFIVTVVPVVLGDGHPLFAGVTQRHALEFVGTHRYGSMVQLVAVPKR